MNKNTPSVISFGKIVNNIIPFFVIGIAFIFTYFNYLTPSNKKNWEYGFETLPEINITGNTVAVKNIRNHQLIDGQINASYLDKTVDATQLERAWFVVEPFTIPPFTNFKGVAHTYFVFDFKDQSPIVVSVEARREKGEKYDSWIGLFNQYELIYVWGTEQDQTVRRVIGEKNKLYMYPLTIPQTSAQNLFLQIAQTSHSLEKEPRFYNTFISNCTNELAKAANRIKAGSVPLNKALFLPGYSAEKLYELGYIPNDQPFEVIKNKYGVTEHIQNLYQESDFSAKLRQKLL